jgi:aryl-alcohol dehydrogenase-like predicted oxidoreductase
MQSLRVHNMALGTAQWGYSYGVTNAVGRISDADCASIIEEAHRAGITALDTAAGYGDAQVRLQPWASEFSLTTKVSGSEPASVIHLFESSLMELGVEYVNGLLIHDWESLDARTQSQVVDELGVIVDRGMANAVGVSIYDMSGVESALETFGDAEVRLGVMQVPANPLDRRLDDSFEIVTLHEQGMRVQVRSVFLQGLLAGPAQAPLAAHPDVVRFHEWTSERGRSSIASCVSHVRSLPWADEIVVGVTSAEELRMVVNAWNGAVAERAPMDLASDDLALIDPRRW